MEAPNSGFSIREHRLRKLEEVITNALPLITVEMCNKVISSVSSLFSDVIQMNDGEFK